MAGKMGRSMTPDEAVKLASESTTIDLQTAGRACGFSKTTTYGRMHDGTFPVPVHKYGSVYRVPTAPLLRYLGIDPNEPAHRPHTPASTSNEEPGASCVVKTKRGKVIHPDDKYKVGGRSYVGSEIIAIARVLGVAS
ncbi:hypothetical protein [Nocardia sp. MW-W600-9]